MRILFVCSEADPFVKTGGLADVCGALPKALARRGHDVRVMLPRYRAIDRGKWGLRPILPEMKVDYAGHTITGEVLVGHLPGTEIPVYFIEQPHLYDRPGIYDGEHGAFGDNDLRFAFLCLAALWTLKGLDWRPDVIHTHDWQAALVPALLKHHPAIVAEPFYHGIGTVQTIHNIAYQGNFAPHIVENCGLPWSVYTSEGMEFYGRASLLKAGLTFSDFVTTVSRTYADEVRTPAFGGGLEGVLSARGERFLGIQNGIDAEVWNPEADKALAKNYTADRPEGKDACKTDLQEFCGLPKRNVPVVAMVSRLVEPKGFDLIKEILPDLLQREDMQAVLLGSGSPRFEKYFSDLARLMPKKFAAKVGYDEKMAHKIYAGADIFLVPSAFEPSGLTQLYAMRYGTVPVVRRTGGLADTVSHASVPEIEAGKSTGFVFNDFLPDALLWGINQALTLYRTDKPHWSRLRRNGMLKNFAWDISAAEYEALYQKTVAVATKA